VRSTSLVPAAISFFILMDQRFYSFAFGLSLVGRHFPQKGFQELPTKDKRPDSKLYDR